MKKLYFLCTKPWIYLSEIPLVVFLVFAIILNPSSDAVWKLYPLITALILGIVFILAYFFKMLILTTDEVNVFSLFAAERDSATLNRGKTLIIGRISPTRIKICVFGNDGQPPQFDFIEHGENYTPIDIFLLRSKVLGANSELIRIMRYFDIPESDAKRLTESNGSFENDITSVSSLCDNSGYQEIKITFKKTI